MPTFQEFFAGGGMVRAGLGAGWTCSFANDIDAVKALTYKNNWGSQEFLLKDVAHVKLDELNGRADLSWASFPCQDLSVAGGGAGLQGVRSGAFNSYWSLILQQVKTGTAPSIIALENVMGAITSNAGRDFSTICEAFAGAGYKFGALALDAVNFLPQSRRRVFFIGVRYDIDINLLDNKLPDSSIHSRSLVSGWNNLSESVKKQWVWWRLPSPPAPRNDLNKFVSEINDDSHRWDSTSKTSHILALMDPNNLKKIDNARLSPTAVIGTVYRRMRPSPDGLNLQRAEARFDGLAGCLRVPRGGSSLQTLIYVHRKIVKTRPISPRETARLMGLSDNYFLPESPTDAYRVTGDGVAVPVVEFLREHIFDPVLIAAKEHRCVSPSAVPEELDAA